MASLSSVWGTISNTVSKVKSSTTSASQKAVISLLDSVLNSTAAEYTMKTFMLANNIANSQRLVSKNIVGVNSLVDSVIFKGSTPPILNQISRTYNEALAEPNIGGIPITTTSIITSRDIDIAEQQVIVQSEGTRKYYTDNAVPRLKEWQLTGYITSLSLSIDNGWTVKPTLTHQQSYLDTVASSRRPVLFKTSRGEFVYVQITSLSFEEDPTYNNAIKITCSLKEYNPYKVTDVGDSPIKAIYGGSNG